MSFYSRVLGQCRDISSSDSILVVCGGAHDVSTLAAAGFTNVTISNLGTKWTQIDAENIACSDDSFDWCVVHAGLHHCGSPHRALTEMYRVARKGVLVIESRDSLLMRIAVRLGLAQEYEFDAIIANRYQCGGLRNGPVPNFVYRWTEREVRKTLESAAPQFENKVRFFYGVAVPERVPRWLRPLISGTGLIFRRQGNSFGFVARKQGLKSWMRDSEHMRQTTN